MDTSSFYQLVTDKAEQTILKLTDETHGQLDDESERSDDPGSGNWHLTAVTYLR